MQRCRVVGSTVSSVKASGLEPFKLLTVRPEPDGGAEIVTVDLVGAGVGDVVLVSTGAALREIPELRGVPADAAVVGIVDPSS